MSAIHIHSSTATLPTNYEIRTETENDKLYTVVPVIMMVEGVHSGSAGPVFHAATELGRNVDAWNGQPVVIHHPTNTSGEFISAHSEGVNRVGVIRNAHMDGVKLRAEAWLEVNKIAVTNPNVISYITDRKPLDVSVGVFTEDENTTGTWNGEAYSKVARNHIPDHLAILPDEQGACSWEDGCGVRVNQKSNAMDKSEFYKLNPIVIQTNKKGYNEISSNIGRMVDSMDSEMSYHYVEEVYEDHFVYRKVNRSNGDHKHYRQDYSMAEDGTITLNSDPVGVRKEVEYLPLTTMKRTNPVSNQTQKQENTMPEGKTPCGECMEKVVSLINNSRTRFTKADRQWLLEQDEATLDKLIPLDPEPVQVNRQSALDVIHDDLTSTEKLLGLLSGEVKEKVEAGLAMYDAQRVDMISAIQTNTEEGTWSDEELQAMPTATLSKLSKSLVKPDYSGQAGASVQANRSNGNAPAPLLPSNVRKN